MFKKLVLGLIIALLALSVISLPTLAQEPDDGAASKGEVDLPQEPGENNSVEQTGPRVDPPFPDANRPSHPMPGPGEMPQLDLSNLTLPGGQALPNPEALKQQRMALLNSLTAEQRAQIRAVLDANKPVYMEQFKSVLGNPQESGRLPEVSLDQLQALDQAGRQWAAAVNAGIKAVLTPEQSAAFDSTLPLHPAERSSMLGVPYGDVTPQTQTDCYYGYYYMYYSNLYAYYGYLYGYYAYLYYWSPYHWYLQYVGSDAEYWSYYAYIYEDYSYDNYYTSYSYYGWIYSVAGLNLAYAGYDLSGDAYWWSGDGYAYYSNYYFYYAWLYAYYGEYYAWYCYAG